MEGRDRSTVRTAAEPVFGVQADNRTGPRKSMESRMRMRIAVAEHTTKVLSGRGGLGPPENG